MESWKLVLLASILILSASLYLLFSETPPPAPNPAFYTSPYVIVVSDYTGDEVVDGKLAMARNLAVIVFSGKGKTVEIQIVAGKACATNEGNVFVSKTVPVEECERRRGAYPYFYIHAPKEGKRTEYGWGIDVYPENVGEIVEESWNALERVFPDAGAVVERVRRKAAEINVEEIKPRSG